MSQPAVDLSKQYGAPFRITSHEEGSRYTFFSSRRHTPPRSLDFGLIRGHGWTDKIDAYCRTLSFQKIVRMNDNGYDHLTLEFYTTLNFSGGDDSKFSFRLLGQHVTLTRKTLREIFGLRKGGHKTVPKSFDPAGFFTEISGAPAVSKNGKLPSALVRDPTLLLMHRYISQVVFGRGDPSHMTAKDLFYLWCLRRDAPVDTARFLIATFKSVAITNKRANLCLGNFITAIAVHSCKFDPVRTEMKVLPTRALCVGVVKNAVFREKEEASSSFSSDEETNPEEGIADQPAAVGAWVLISREMERMQARMNDGFNDLKSGFDGLEEKVSAVCARIQTFQREWADLRRGESNVTKSVGKLSAAENTTIELLKLEKSESDKAAEMYKTKLEKMSTRIRKIEEGLATISSMNVVDLANFVNEMRDIGTFEEGEDSEFPDSMCKNDSFENRTIKPDVDAELFTSNSIGSRGLSKNGNRNSPQPWTRKDDIAHTVKNSPCSHPGHNLPQPQSNECIEPLGSAARDIIILDSDDETKPKGAAEDSKRGIGSVDTDLVQGSKRKRTESMDSLFPTSKRNKDAMTC